MTKAEEHWRRYLAAAHAMQTGVAIEMEEPIAGQPQSTDPKMLRVGVNSAMVEHSALVKLLIGKGVIREEDFFEALADGMEAEAKQYEERLTRRFGQKVKLG